MGKKMTNSVNTKVEASTPVGHRSYDDPIMSLVPSSPAVNEMLERMRAEKAAARAAVEAAKVEWEAEMLLALEEFRDTGGFSEFYKSVVSFFESLDTNDYGTPKKSFKELLARYYQSMKIHYAFQQRDGAADIRSVFMADKMAIETMLYYGFEDLSLIHI